MHPLFLGEIIRTALASLFLLVFSIPVWAQSPPTPTAADLYPLQVGNAWHFKLTQGETTAELSYVIRKTENIDGVELYRIETHMDGNSAASEHLAVTAEGVFRHRFNGLELSPPLKLIANPLKFDEEWKATINAGDETIKCTSKLGKPVDVSVPAGDYQAYELTVEAVTAGDVKVLTNYWLVPKVGIVMQDLTIDGQEIFTIELTKFEPAKELPKESAQQP